MKNKSKQLSKFLCYLMGRRPDEFGLVPDENGFYKIKEILKALSEEQGWKSTGQGNINEIFLTMSDHGLERGESLIRAQDRSNLPVNEIIYDPPKILYIGVRNKAYPHIFEKGINPIGGKNFVILSSNEEMAVRIGKRRDSNPVLLSVQTRKLIKKGYDISQFGEYLFLVDHVPSDCFAGPPLPKEKEKKITKEKEVKPKEQKEYGSFLLDLEQMEDKTAQKRKRAKKEIKWKRDARKNRRKKEKM